LQRPSDAPAVEWKTISVGDTLNGYVQDVKNENIWISFSPFVKGRCFIPDCAATLEDCDEASSAYPVGTPVATKVVSVNHDKHAMDVVLLDGKHGDGTRSFAAGTLACGYVTGASGNGIAVKLAWDTVGRVNLTDIYSVAVRNALSPAEALKGTFVKVAVVSTKATKTNPSISLSLRPSAGAISTLDESKCGTLPSALVPKPSIKLAELSPGTAVSGYVKVAGKMGVFITLGRDLEARIKLRQLQDEFVEDPLASYPPGTFVQGRIVSINNGKIDVSLRTRKTNTNVDGYREGQIVQGTVKRIEKFGVFISIADSTLTGMAHVSELCDGFVQDIDKLFKVGQEVQARVINVDKENGKLSLGLKPSYFELGDEGDEDDDQNMLDADGQDSDDDLDQALLAARGDAMSSGDDGPGDSGDDESNDESDEVDLDELLVS
jgi:rRNA biogenesis protein RRP5